MAGEAQSQQPLGADDATAAHAVQPARVERPNGPDLAALEQAVTRHTRHMQSGLEACETVRFGGEKPLPVPNGLRVYAVAAPDAVGGHGEAPPALIVTATIASGGMGTVVAAKQVSLDRDIAVKRTRSTEPREAEALLSEAQIAGRLQHPNVVPVYDLGLDDAKRPILLMKRIEGHTWTTDLRAPPEPATPDWDRWLERQLRVLLQVCNAIHFAHSRGVVHRDLKPANVMVGDFGEVYVLDWGIALRVVDEDGKRVWHPVDPARVEGTLAFMAPEQAAAVDEPISERTDVFQLGALLYAVLTGRPPYAHDEPAELVRAMCATDVPPLPDPVPKELAAICMRALARDVAARYESALAFKAAVETWLQRRPSFELTRAGQRHLDALQSAMAAGADADEVAALFGQARFGFQQALVVWPGNAEAHLGWQRTLATVARQALHREDVRHATQLIKELGDSAAELQSDLDALRVRLDARAREQQQEFDRLARIAQDHDQHRGAGARSVLIRLLGGLFVAAFWLSQAAAYAGWLEVRVWHNLASGAVAMGIVAAVGWRFWASVARTAQNRAAYTIVLGMTLVGEAFRVCAAALGATLPQVQILDLAVFAMTSVGVAAVFDLRLLWMAVALAVAAAVGAAYPDWLLGCTGAAIGVSFAWMDHRIGRR